MNNQELENSLRTEIDNYLKSMFAEMRQEVAELQTTLDSEFDRHRNQIRESFEQLTSRSPQTVKVDDEFAVLVAEHLKVAREDGVNEATELLAQQQPEAQQSQPAGADFSQMRDAINDISQQTSQAEILKGLVKHAENFAPRGALFIVKSEHLIGWRAFGAEGAAEEAVREVFMPLANDSVLTAAVRNQAIETGGFGEHDDDQRFLQKLEFGEPVRMAAIPLVVRGRGVAVLYADGETMSVEALESLVRVAGMTVEMLAAARNPANARPAAGEQTAPKFSTFTEKEKPVPSFGASRQTEPAAAEQPQPVSASNYETSFNNRSTDYSTDYAAPVVPSYEETRQNETYNTPSVSTQTEPASASNTGYETFSFSDAAQVSSPYGDVAAQPIEAQQQTATESAYSRYGEPQSNEMQFGSTAAMPQTEIADAPPVTIVDPPAATQSEPASGSTRRFGERNVDLPIDVPEDERRLHNDARRFARLLVSEIKLYNEQKVKEGRESGDLYDRLREAIDRSREMYDKRVAPPVAAKFDYFHYELVNTLAEGDDARLGREYMTANA